VTQAVAADAGVLPWQYEPFAVLDRIVKEVGEAASEADRHVLALRHLRSWAFSNPQRFFGRHESVRVGEHEYEPKVPLYGWAGAWDDEEAWKFIAFLPHVLKNTLVEGGFEPNSCLAAFADRGWLLCDKGRKQKEIRTGIGKTRFFCITRAAFDDAHETPAEESSTEDLDDEFEDEGWAY
jgi:hypothetical protein